MALLAKISTLLVVAVFLLLSIIVYNAINPVSYQSTDNFNKNVLSKLSKEERNWFKETLEAIEKIPRDNHPSIERLQRVIQFKTISEPFNPRNNFEEFVQQKEYLEKSFPLVFSRLETIRFSEDEIIRSSILLKWKGSNPNLKPFLLASHLDVVPIAPNTEHLWGEEPFSGKIRDGYLYGRGALDDKMGVIGILSAVEELLQINPIFEPKRTLYIAFGHDEEVSGANGALPIVNYLLSQNIRLEYVLDEGGLIIDKLPPIVDKETAMIATAEKGSVILKLTVEGTGGHSSMPPNETPIGILSRAISTLESTQFPKTFNKAFRDMMEFTASTAPFATRLISSNLWFFSHFITKILPSSASTINASMRTTIAPTVFNAGEKDNVLPKDASAVIDFRIIPGETVDIVIENVKRIINDERVIISVLSSGNPSPISPTDNLAWNIVQSTVKNFDPDLIVTPFLAICVTDGRFYYALTESVYRFIPIRLTQETLSKFHGIDEGVTTKEIVDSVVFYAKLILHSQFDSPNSKNAVEKEL